jgi:saccharopine dehydrogenase (NAD+, L-lysine-forming)
MAPIIGIRREDKNKWERRVPLVPAHIAELKQAHGIDFLVQPSPIRVFTDDEYQEAGAMVDEDLSPADVVLAVKEIPVAMLQGARAFVYFSHVIKGQDYNMPMLQHLLDEGATLIDYEKIADGQNRRMIFFSIHAGYAGMIESLVALGQRLEHLGKRTPFLEVKHAYEYASLDEAKAHLREIGRRLTDEGLGDHGKPIIFGLAGYGNVYKGCREILDCLPVRDIEVDQLPAMAEAGLDEAGPLLAVVFKEEDMVEPRSRDAQFVLQDYYQHPENYRGVFENYLPHLDVLMSTIFWDTQYPRLVSRKWVKSSYGPGKGPRLLVIGDISCDIEGGIEVTVKAPHPDNPCFVYDVNQDEAIDGVQGDGPVVMAVDNLPCELPRESSEHFSNILRDMVPALARADFKADFDSLDLPPHLKRAVITHQGQLTPDFRYLQKSLDKELG